MDNLKERYDKDGFVIVRGLVSPTEMLRLREASERVVTRTRSGDWPHRRVVGKQFPPFGDANPDSWGVQHLMHPGLHEPVFAEWYTSDTLIDVIKGLMTCKEDDLQMGMPTYLLFSHDSPETFLKI